MTIMYGMRVKEGAVAWIFLLLLVACPLVAMSNLGAHHCIEAADAESHPFTTITPSAAILFQEDFNGYSTGAYPSGWFTHDNRSSGTVFDVNNTIIDSGNCLRIVDNQTADAGWGRRQFSKAIEAGILEFKVRVHGANNGSNPMQHYVNLQGSTNITYVSVNMQQNLTGDYWTIGIDGTLGTTMNATHLAEDTTYSIKVCFSKVFYLFVNTFFIDLYVNNALFLSDQITLFTAVDRLYVGSTNPTNGSLWLFDTFVVTDMVAGSVMPSITSPPDLYLPSGASGRSITWTIIDPDTLNPTYLLHINGSLALPTPWSSGVPVQYDLPSITGPVMYNFTIIVSDGLNNTVRDTVWVFVSANTPPVITGKAIVTFEYGSSGENIKWTITDPSVNVGTYQISSNVSGAIWGNWVSGQTIAANTTILGIGSYNITITANDGMSNSTSFTTILYIVGDLPPRISSPTDVTYQADSTGNKLIWTISDFNMTTGWYAIYKDDVLQSNVTWTGPTATVSINIDGLAQGGHTYKIVASDGRHMSSDTVSVTVTNPLMDALIIVLVIAGAAIVVVAIIAVKRKKKAGGTKVKRKVPQQAAAKPTKDPAQHAPLAAPAGGKVVTCPSCGTPFTLAADYLKQYAGQTFKCTKCQVDIPI
jgi:hypothetical protein